MSEIFKYATYFYVIKKFTGIEMALTESFSNHGQGVSVSSGQARFIRLEIDDPTSLTNLLSKIILSPSIGNGSVAAVIFDPFHPHRDENGHVDLSETELVRQLNLMDQTRSAREPAYRQALEAVQREKYRLGLTRDTPLITAETKFGKAATNTPEATPK